MKYFKISFSMLFLAIFAQSCLKDNSDFDNFQNQGNRLLGDNKIVEVRLTGTDATNFLAISVAPTQTTIDLIPIQIASVNVPTEDIEVTLESDPSIITAYNTANGTTFTPMPTSKYTAVNNAVVKIPAGSRLGYLKITLNPQDLLNNEYAIAYKIKSVNNSAYKISGNLFKGMVALAFRNILEETYKWDLFRYNNNTGTGSVAGGSFTGRSTVFSSVGATQNEVPSGYFIQPRYVINYSLVGGVPSNFVVTINANDIADLAANGVTIVSGPNILIADYANRHFKFQYIVFNGSAFRYLIDEYYK